MLSILFLPAEKDVFVDRELESWWVGFSLLVMVFGIEVVEIWPPMLARGCGG